MPGPATQFPASVFQYWPRAEAGQGYAQRPMERAKRHARGSHVKDPYRLRVNAYRVLLTRGRDAAVVFVPPDRRLDATAAWLQAHGARVLG